MNKIGLKELYEMAKNKNNPQKLSPFIESGEVSAVILTDNGNIFTGVCIDTALANMITNVVG